MVFEQLWKDVNQIIKTQLYYAISLQTTVLEFIAYDRTLVKTRDKTITEWFPISDLSTDITFLVVDVYAS